jgi:hypothetical protein
MALMFPTAFWILEGYRKFYEIHLTRLGASPICRHERKPGIGFCPVPIWKDNIFQSPDPKQIE